jgi:hypothetical protein
MPDWGRSDHSARAPGDPRPGSAPKKRAYVILNTCARTAVPGVWGVRSVLEYLTRSRISALRHRCASLVPPPRCVVGRQRGAAHDQR